MTQNEFVKPRINREPTVETTHSPKEQVSLDFSDLLDQIDSVLEKNAEEFVNNFVQKGGQ